jgi:poly-gamma-glutamate synthesis protein (capsule biosynthesis protein)
VNGISVAFLGFVNWTNTDPTEEAEYQLVWIDDEESVKTYIERAKEQADVVVVYAHWGEENENIITEQMSSMAQKMVNWGADIVYGDHTHVLQKITVLERESDGALCPVQFCGGNFLSGQKERAHLLSVLTTVEVGKNPETGEVAVTGMTALPLVTHYEGDRQNVVIYPLDDYTEELAEQNGVKQFENETMTLDYMWDLVHAEIPDQYLIHTDNRSENSV